MIKTPLKHALTNYQIINTHLFQPPQRAVAVAPVPDVLSNRSRVSSLQPQCHAEVEERALVLMQREEALASREVVQRLAAICRERVGEQTGAGLVVGVGTGLAQQDQRLLAHLAGVDVITLRRLWLSHFVCSLVSALGLL